MVEIKEKKKRLELPHFYTTRHFDQTASGLMTERSPLQTRSLVASPQLS